MSTRVLTRSSTRKATRKGAILRAPDRLGEVEDPGMCGSSLHGNREVSDLTCGGTPQARAGKTRSSSREADEQSGAIRRGIGGAKGRGQGNRGPAKHAPGSEPGKRVTGAGSRTASSKATEE